MNQKEIAVVLLNYNDIANLEVALSQMEKQTINTSFIIVDNDSAQENKKYLRKMIEEKNSSYVAEKFSYFSSEIPPNKKYYLIWNDKNVGFSGGNNVGLKVAHMLGFKYVFLMNPDVRIDEIYYLEKMLTAIKLFPIAGVEGSNIIDLDGRKQSPSKISTFKDEFFWFIPKIKNRNSTLLIESSGVQILDNRTVHGCCMLFDLDFLSEIDYLDEGVFMYCEESILQAKIEKYGRKILFNPTVTAIHAHQRSKKANSSLRMQLFLKSRMYYIKEYSTYSDLQKALIRLSYGLCSVLYKVKYRFSITRMNNKS